MGCHRLGIDAKSTWHLRNNRKAVGVLQAHLLNWKLIAGLAVKLLGGGSNGQSGGRGGPRQAAVSEAETGGNQDPSVDPSEGSPREIR